MKKQLQGFTLIELMIAIIIFSIMATMAYSGLNSVLKSHDLLNKQQENFNQLNQIINQFQKEIRQIVPRPVHDKYSTLIPALKLETSNEIIFSFTRAGIPNPSGLQKNSLQRIDYLFSGKTLKKRTWLTIDRNNSADYSEEIISTNLNKFKIDILGFNNAWYQQWPTNNNDPIDLLPKAIRINLTLQDLGDINRLVELPL